MSTRGFTVWVTGPDPAALHAVADELANRLAARGVPVELLDARAPGLARLVDPPGAAVLAASVLARHGVAAVIALPATGAVRDAARAELERMIEVDVPGDAKAGHEPPERAEVEIAAGAGAPGAARVLRTLEVLRLLPAGADRGYSEDEERAVIRRLKAFGYL